MTVFSFVEFYCPSFHYQNRRELKRRCILVSKYH